MSISHYTFTDFQPALEFFGDALPKPMAWAGICRTCGAVERDGWMRLASIPHRVAMKD